MPGYVEHIGTGKYGAMYKIKRSGETFLEWFETSSARNTRVRQLKNDSRYVFLSPRNR